MNKRAVAWLAWPLAAISVPLCVISLLLGLSRTDPVAGVEGFEFGEGLQYMTEWLFGAVGAVIVSRHPGNRVGWIFCALGISATLGLFAYEYGVYTLATRPGSLPGGAEMAWLGRWLWAPAFGLWALSLLYFRRQTAIAPLATFRMARGRRNRADRHPRLGRLPHRALLPREG